MKWSFPCPRPSCHAVIVEGGRVLLIERAHEPYQGFWGMPGGAVELGETVAEALCREVREETGLEVEVGDLVTYRDAIAHGPDGGVAYHFVIMYHRARVVGGQLRAGDDAARVAWVPLPEADYLPLVPGLAEVMHAAVRGETRSSPGAGA